MPPLDHGSMYIIKKRPHALFQERVQHTVLPRTIRNRLWASSTAKPQPVLSSTNMLEKLSKIAFAICVVVVIVLSVTPTEGILAGTNVSDKIRHIAAYSMLALVGGVAFRGIWSLWLLAAGLVFLGVALECVQILIPGRAASGYDILADVIGTAFGIAFTVKWQTSFSKWKGRRR